MIKSETKYWEHLRDHNFKRIPNSHFSRIESHATALGIPDVNAVIQGRDVWIELKHCLSWTDELTLRGSQHRWMQERIKAGAKNVWILAHVADTGSNMLIRAEGGTKDLIDNPSVDHWWSRAEAKWHYKKIDNRELLEIILWDMN